MNILINASNIKKGGGLQVADSVCRELFKFPQHTFVVVLSKHFENTREALSSMPNVTTYVYDIQNSLITVLFGRDHFLDGLVRNQKVDAVLTIFGPSRWIPKVHHLSGFAQGHIVLPDSPFWGMLPTKQRLSMKLKLWVIKQSLRKCANNYFTENPLITERLHKIFPRKRIHTVTNNVNQIFYHPDNWDRSISLPSFNGITLLTVAANYPHKNLKIIIPVTSWLKEHRPNLKFRFVLTIRKEDFPVIGEDIRKHIVFLGPVDISQVPYLYEQSDIMLLPTLLECFSASYAEAMLMKTPILTTDLIFAHGLCGDAALYYEATSYEDLGNSILRLAEDATLRETLVTNGISQISQFDTFEQRAKKMIEIVETMK